VLAMAPYLGPYLPFSERLVGLALPAAREALASVTGRLPAPLSIATFLGLPSARPGLPADMGPELARQLTMATMPEYRLSPMQVLPQGHAAGLMAVEAACRSIREEKSLFCLAGGVDGYIDPDTMDWLEEHEQVHHPDNAWGFIAGEAASFCLLCGEKVAEEMKLRVLCRIVAIATDMEPNRIKTDTICLGHGLTKVFRQVLPSLPPETRINHTICDQNGESYRADEYGF